MVVSWFRERREFRDRVIAEADRLQAEHGRAAYATAAIAARTVQSDWRFAQAWSWSARCRDRPRA